MTFSKFGEYESPDNHTHISDGQQEYVPESRPPFKDIESLIDSMVRESLELGVYTSFRKSMDWMAARSQKRDADDVDDFAFWHDAARLEYPLLSLLSSWDEVGGEHVMVGRVDPETLQVRGAVASVGVILSDGTWYDEQPPINRFFSREQTFALHLQGRILKYCGVDLLDQK